MRLFSVFNFRLLFFIISILNFGCRHFTLPIDRISFREFYSESLKLRIEIDTRSADSLMMEYWEEGFPDTRRKMKANTSYNLVFYFDKLKSNTKYFFQLQSSDYKKSSKIFNYKTRKISNYINVSFNRMNFSNSSSVSGSFLKGGILLNKREPPGALYIVDPLGQIKWQYFFDNYGVRVSHFTKQNTIISILGTEADPTSYGCSIIEVNAKGDTLLNLSLGESGLLFTPHHEVFKDQFGNIILLYLEKRMVDLSSVGGHVQDTVAGDGILVLSPKGKQIWKWNIFDKVNPISYKNILKEKSDWLHANSLSYDSDGNFLISFFNIGQVWKIHSTSGEILWKLGANGNFKIDPHNFFEQSHSFHTCTKGRYLFFDNQLKTKKSKIHCYELDESTYNTRSVVNFSLPAEYFSDRMGSSYFVNDTSLLTCSSKKGKIILTNLKGDLLWGLHTSSLTPYRAEYIQLNDLENFLNYKE